VVGRKRPSGGSNDSFPSGHATVAASFSTLAAKNIEAMQLSKTAEISSDIGLGVIAAGTAWARVEAKAHYPSDVLAGIAIGHFLSAFINDAFLGNEKSRGISSAADISKDGFLVNFAWHY
jgi:membrane-associated phospholipid phosphatase